MKPSYNELIRLVELDDLEQAIAQLRDIATGARSKELALLSNRYSAWNKDRRMGMPTTNHEKNAIVAALLSIIDDQFREAELSRLAEPVKIVNPHEGDKLKKVFISHAFKNKEQVGIVIDLLEAIGIKSNQIFTQGMKINDPAKLNSLKSKLEQLFSLPAIDVSIWERRRNNVIKQLDLNHARSTTVTRTG